MLPGAERLNALVVGAGQGIGLGFVQALLADTRVRRIYATYRRSESAGELLALAGEQGERLSCLRLDVTEEEQIGEAFRTISGEVKSLDLALYCVGVLHEGEMQPEKSLSQLNSENLLRSFAVNSVGAALVAKHLKPLLRRDSPSIFASISAKVGSIGDNRLGGWYGYRASKAALNMLVKTIAIEYGRSHPAAIVVALHPGTTDTRLSKPFQANVPEEQLFPVERTVELLLGVMAKLEPSDSGGFFSWNGSRLPW